MLETKNEILKNLKKLNPSQATIHRIIKLALSSNNSDTPCFSKYKSLTLNSLFNAYRKSFLLCFKSYNMEDDELLIVDECGEINMFGENFKMVKRSKIV